MVRNGLEWKNILKIYDQYKLYIIASSGSCLATFNKLVFSLPEHVGRQRPDDPRNAPLSFLLFIMIRAVRLHLTGGQVSDFREEDVLLTYLFRPNRNNHQCSGIRQQWHQTVSISARSIFYPKDMSAEPRQLHER